MEGHHTMKKTLATLSTIAMLGFAGTALGEEASGTVMAVDPASRLIQLDDGAVYAVSDGVALDALQPGTEVTVSYEEQNGENVITEVAPAEQ
jgi:Cu/Ag efflux protein CusF